MIKLNRFTINTDFASLANDDATSVSLTLPQQFTAAVGQFVEFHQDIKVGQPNAQMSVLTRASASSAWSPTSSFYLGVTTSAGPDAMIVSVSRISETMVRLSASYPNPYSTTVTVATGSPAITALILTFLNPFVL